MKLIASNGRELTVRDCGPVVGRWVSPPRGMVPYHGTRVVEDDVAREVVRVALSGGCVRAE